METLATFHLELNHQLVYPSLSDKEASFWQENIPVEEVFEKLKCTKEGLNSDEVEKRLNMFGYNKLEEKTVWF